MLIDDLHYDLIAYPFLIQRVMQHQDDSALLRSYRYEWERFFAQCNYLPLPFQTLETAMRKDKASQNLHKKNKSEDSLVRNVCT